MRTRGLAEALAMLTIAQDGIVVQNERRPAFQFGASHAGGHSFDE